MSENNINKLSRLQELEANEDFQRLSEDKKIILLAGEKILEMDAYFKNVLSQFTNESLFVSENIESSLVNKVIKKIQLDFGSSLNVSKEDVVELIDQKYNEERISLENKYQFATQQAIKNMDESFSEALQKVENLSQFQIQAREEIRKNQDKIYILQEELLRQKEKNDALQKMIDDSLEKANLSSENIFLNNYEYLGQSFSNFEEFQEFIRSEARNIAENEIEKYLHEKDMFSDELSPDMKSSLQDHEMLNEEILKIYKTQVNNGSKLDELEKLIEKQNQEIKLLSEERKEFISKIADVIRWNDGEDKKISNELLENYFEKINSEKDKNVNELYDENNEDNDDIQIDLSDPNKILTNNEIEFLIKNEAIELVKNRLNELSDKSDDEINEIILNNLHKKHNSIYQKNLSEMIQFNNAKKEEISKVNQKIIELQQQLRNQIEQNESLKNELLNGMVKSESYDFYNDIINYDNEFSEFTDEEDMSKHNYYDGKSPIPGTKIMRINNHRINNDLDSTSFYETQEIIRTEVEKQEKADIFEEIETKNNVANEVVWQENNQKIVDLENIVQKQQEELQRLRNQNSQETTFEQKNNYVQNYNQSNFDQSNKQIEFMNSLEQTLSQLKELSNIQAQTVADLERQSKKLEEMEQKAKEEETSRFVTHENLDQIISEKYKNQKASEAYYEELKKVEDERKKIEEALELERLRLISEINLGKEKLETTKPQGQDQFKENEEEKEVDTKSDIVLVETPKKKRKQQIFYEIKVHDKPKVTRADLEK